MGDEELSEAVVELARLRNAFEAAEARVAATWDSRRAWAADAPIPAPRPKDANAAALASRRPR